MNEDSKRNLIKKIIGERNMTDYTFLILFLLISAFFAFFAIKPALTTAFSLQKEIDNLKNVNYLYENIIKRVVSIQQDMQLIRDNINVLNRALPDSPDIKNLIEDMNAKAREKGFNIEKMDISPINLKAKHGDRLLQSYTITFESILTYDQFDYLRKTLLKDLRIKKIRELSVKKIQGRESSLSAQLQTNIILDVFYL